MMTFTQWLLFQLAGEASELAKEATKGGQFGVGSEHQGVSNLKLIQAEFMDVVGVIEILNTQDDVREHLGINENIGLGDSGHTLGGQRWAQSWTKSYKVSYYAIRAIGNEVFMPTWYEFNMILRFALQWHTNYAKYPTEDERTFMHGFIEGVKSRVRAYHRANGTLDETLTDIDTKDE